MTDDGSDKGGSDKAFSDKVAPEPTFEVVVEPAAEQKKKSKEDSDSDSSSDSEHVEQDGNSANNVMSALQKNRSVQFVMEPETQVARTRSSGSDNSGFGFGNQMSFASKNLSTKSALTARSSMENKPQNHIKVLFLLQGVLLGCGLLICLFAVLRFSFYCPEFDIPNPLWYSCWELGLFIALPGSLVVINMVDGAFPPEVRNSRRNKIGMTIFWVVSLAISSTYALKKRNMKLLNMVRLATCFMFGGCFAYGMWNRIAGNELARQADDATTDDDTDAESEDSQKEKPTPPVPWMSWRIKPHSPRDRKLFRAFGRFFVVFFIGWYGALLFADMFETAQMKLKSTFTNDTVLWGSFTIGNAMQSAGEIFLASFFFSVYLPKWSQWTAMAATFICENYFEEILGINEVNKERVGLFTNFALDLVRFIYGRGVMFKLSNFYIFFLFLTKDLCYQWWHFGFKYSEDYIVFVLKVFHPTGPSGLPPLWVTIARGVESWVKCMGIAKNLAVCWWDEIDYNDHLPIGQKRGPTTNISISLTFVNMNIKIKNLPPNIGKILKKAQAGGGGAAADGEGQVESNGPAGGSNNAAKADTALNKAARRQSLAFHVGEPDVEQYDIPTSKSGDGDFSLTSDDVGARPGHSAGLHSIASAASRGVSSTGSGRRTNLNVDFGQNSTSLSPVDEAKQAKEDDQEPIVLRPSVHAINSATFNKLDPAQEKRLQSMSNGMLPLDPEAQQLLQGVSASLQSAIFNRYQTRATAKFFTSYLFMLVPILTRMTNGKNSPGYTDPFGSGPESEKYLIAGLAFFLTDLFEWLGITFGVLYRKTRDIHTKIDIYRQLLTKNRAVLQCFIWLAVVMGAYMYNRMWMPFNTKTMSRHLIKKYPDGTPALIDGMDLAQSYGGELLQKVNDGTVTVVPDWDFIFDACGY